MTRSEPCDLGAVEARDAIARGQLTVRALLESCINRIETENPRVNAVVTTCYDTAREKADELDAMRDNVATLPSLFGLPVLVKDLIDTRQLKTTYGSLCFADHVPTRDGDIIRRLRAAGAIILGKTNTPEFGAGANTFNKVFGATRNPHDTSLTCGGSSGGSAVAVACGMAPLAIGSDFGGSLRIPASFCGVVGMRPTAGRVPCSDLAVSNSMLWTEGPMARSVKDAALCFSAIEGFEPGDPRSSLRDRGSCAEAIDLKNLRVGISSDFGIATMDQNVHSIAKERLSKIMGLFSEGKDIAMDFSGAADAFRVSRLLDVTTNAIARKVSGDDRFGDNVTANLSEAEAVSLTDCARATAEHAKIMRNFQALFDDVDVILAPATGVSPFPIEQPFPTTINGAPLDNYTSWYALTWVISLTGCPVLAIPLGMDHLGMPFGIQVIAPRYRDELAVAVASSLQSEIQKLNFGGQAKSAPAMASQR